MKSIISVKNLIKKYNRESQNAVDDITFEVLEGEFFALLCQMELVKQPLSQF